MVHKLYATHFRQLPQIVPEVASILWLHTFMFSTDVLPYLNFGLIKCLENILQSPNHKGLLFLFNNDSVPGDRNRLTLRKIILVGLTVTKKKIMNSWFAPEPTSIKEWLNHFREIALIESSLTVIYFNEACSSWFNFHQITALQH